MSRRSALMLIGGGGALLAAGSGAYASARGERPFDIPAVQDEVALLGISKHSVSGDDGEEVPLMDITNNFGESIHTLSVEVVDVGQGNLDIENIDVPSSLSSGNSATITGVLSCSGRAENVEVEVEILASGDTDSFEGTRTLEVSCVDVEPRSRYDCEDILEMPCDYEETGDYSIYHETLDGHLCIDGNGGQTSVTIGQHSGVDGFVRVRDVSDLQFTMERHAEVDGAVNLHDVGEVSCATIWNHARIAGEFCATASGDINLDVRNNSDLERSLHVDAGNDVTVFVRNNAVIDGDLVIRAGGDANVQIAHNAEISGEVVVQADGNEERGSQPAGQGPCEDITGGARP